MTAEILRDQVELFLLMSDEDALIDGAIANVDVHECAGELRIYVYMVDAEMVIVHVPKHFSRADKEDADALSYYLEPPCSN